VSVGLGQVTRVVVKRWLGNEPSSPPKYVQFQQASSRSATQRNDPFTLEALSEERRSLRASVCKGGLHVNVFFLAPDAASRFPDTQPAKVHGVVDRAAASWVGYAEAPQCEPGQEVRRNRQVSYRFR
jgi:hypothetical protein